MKLDERLSPEDELPADTTPEWLKIIEEDGQPTAVEEVSPSPPIEQEIVPETPISVEPSEAPVENILEAVLEDEDDFSMDWLDNISQEAAAEAAVEGQIATPAETPDEVSLEEPVSEEGLPDWLDEIEETADEFCGQR